MLIPVKPYVVNTSIPSLADFEAAKQICIHENCIVELRWQPSILVGWYYLNIDEKSDIYEMYNKQVPKEYGV